jgi:pteridine reductase
MTRDLLRGKTALVTGASGRIGRGIARALAAEGVHIVAHYHTSKKETEALCATVRTSGVQAWALKADFRNKKHVETIVTKACRLAGSIDILVNSASLYTKSTLKDLTPADLIENMTVNAWTPLALGRAFKHAAGRGAVITILDSRVAGYDWSHVGYIISKHALAVLTRMMAVEFAPGITVNGVAPGLIAPYHDKGRSSIDRLSQNLPLQRCGEIDDVAQAVLFLLKSRFITGQVILVDGGRHLRGQ